MTAAERPPARSRWLWSKDRDTGGMFDHTYGVYADGGRFRAVVMDGWSAGARSRLFDTPEAAEADLPRLWERVTGEQW